MQKEIMVETITENASKPEWVKMKPAELEKLIVELGKQGETPANIGNILRDKHGVPKAKLMGKKVSQILNEHKIKFTTEKDLMGVKIKKIEAHAAKHKHDKGAKRSLTKKLWAIKKLQ